MHAKETLWIQNLSHIFRREKTVEKRNSRGLGLQSAPGARWFDADSLVDALVRISEERPTTAPVSSKELEAAMLPMMGVVTPRGVAMRLLMEMGLATIVVEGVAMLGVVGLARKKAMR